jgi:hypothetical protein
VHTCGVSCRSVLLVGEEDLCVWVLRSGGSLAEEDWCLKRVVVVVVVVVWCGTWETGARLLC